VETTYLELENFFSTYRRVKFKKGEVILSAEEEPKGVYFLSKGYVKQYSISPTGEELILIIFKPGDFFPIIWALNETAYHYYLETITPVELFCAPREEFIRFLRSNPNIMFELTSKILTRTGGLLSRMENLVFGNAYHKIVSILSICADRFGDKTPQGVKIPFHLTHKLIGNFTGLSRETTSVEMKNLEKAGLIKYHGSTLLIKNPKALKEESLL
jgi:CRP/FNR family transcriptional regulator, cyclic AMP receptor protein